MVYIHIPSQEIYKLLTDQLLEKYGIQVRRRFVGFRVETGNSPVSIVNQQNVKYVAWQINREMAGQDEAEVVTEIFRNNSAFWKLKKDKK